MEQRRVLLIAQDTPGILWPALLLCREWQRVGYAVSVITGSSSASLVRSLGFEPLPTGADACFDISNWHVTEQVAIQTRVVLDAVRRLRPDVVISSQMCISYAFLPRSHYRRLLVLASFTPLWPRRALQHDMSPVVGTRAYREQRRYSDWVECARRAASYLGTSAPSHEEIDKWYGDAVLVRNVTEVDPLPKNHYDKFIFVGDLLFEPADTDTQEWCKYARSTDREVIYVQHGRHFGKPSLWRCVDRLLSTQRYPAVVDLRRYDGAFPRLQCEAHYRKFVPLLALMERVRGIVSSGGATTVLAALRYQKPLLVGMVGSGGEELRDLVQARGLAVVFDPGEALPEQDERLSTFLQSGPDPAEAARVQAAFASVDLHPADALAMGDRR